MQVWGEQHSCVGEGPREIQTLVSGPPMRLSHVPQGALKSLLAVLYLEELIRVRNLLHPK